MKCSSKGNNSVQRCTREFLWTLTPMRRTKRGGRRWNGIRYTQFLEGTRSTSKGRGDDSFPEEHGHSWFAVDDLSHPATLADKSWALTRKPESFVLEGASWSSLSLAIFLGQIVRLAKVLVDVGRRPVVGQGGLHADRVSPSILYVTARIILIVWSKQ